MKLVATLVALLFACGGSTQNGTAAPGRSPCERECEIQGGTCDNSCNTEKPDERNACLDRCSDARARCVSGCHP